MPEVTPVKTQEEIEAEVEQKKAEAIKAQAEARAAEAAATESLAKARKVAAEAEQAEILRDKAVEQRQRDKATDEENHVYRFDTQVGSSSVKNCMAKLSEWDRLNPTCDIEVIFSSPGGNIIDGMALFDFLVSLRVEELDEEGKKKRGHRVTTGCAGMAASMAGILLQAGSHRWIGEQSWVLIHRASFGVIGSTYTVEDELEWIKRIEKRIIDIFVRRSKLTSTKIKKNWERKDFWISADEALEFGLVDEVRGVLV